MNNVELNAILYYADYLSLKAVSTPVTDNCKYFFIYRVPINSATILGMDIEYDEQNPYFQLAKVEYDIIKDKFGEDGVESFIDDICSIKAAGSVDATQMLKNIHQYSTKRERKQAFNTYNDWKNNQIFTHTVLDEDGNPQEKRCSKYVYHAERMLGKPGLAKSIRNTLERH